MELTPENDRVESNAFEEFARAMEPTNSLFSMSGSEEGKLNLDPESTKNGLAQLVLALVKFLHELLERQAIRRIDAGTLTDEEIERLGEALLRQTEEIDRIRKEFGLEEEDLNLDLGPLGKLI